VEQVKRRGALGATFIGILAALTFAANAYAAALVTDLKGDVRAAIRAGTPAPVEKGQQLDSGSTVTTGRGSQVSLRFDGGEQVVLHENTQFQIVEYRYEEGNPKADRSVFSLLRGAARAVTGLLARRSRQAFEFRTSTATIGIRGTDFMVAIVGQPSYVSVLEGAVAATNAAGTVAFTAGTFGAITASTVLAAAIPASALPTAAASAFSSLGAVTVGAAAAAAGAGIGAGAIAAGVVAAGAVAASNSSSGGGESTSGTTTSGGSTSGGTTTSFTGSWSGTQSWTFTELSACGTAVNQTITCSWPWTGTVDSSNVFTGATGTVTCDVPGYGTFAQTNAQAIGPVQIASDGTAAWSTGISGSELGGCTSTSTVNYSCSSSTLTFASGSVSGSYTCTFSGDLVGDIQVNLTGSGP
jgi:hypothetical protein